MFYPTVISLFIGVNNLHKCHQVPYLAPDCSVWTVIDSDLNHFSIVSIIQLITQALWLGPKKKRKETLENVNFISM